MPPHLYGVCARRWANHTTPHQTTPETATNPIGGPYITVSRSLLSTLCYYAS